MTHDDGLAGWVKGTMAGAGQTKGQTPRFGEGVFGDGAQMLQLIK